MNALNGITILLIYQLIGEFGVLFLDIPVPGPVLGLILLFLTLLLGGGTSASLDSSSTGLLNHLSLLFVPAGVGAMVHFDRIANEWVPITITLVLSTIITMAATAAIMQSVDHLLTKRFHKNG